VSCPTEDLNVHCSFRRLAAVLIIATSMQTFAPVLGTGTALAAPEPAKSNAKPQANSTGYDISYPQCSAAFPRSPAFGIVGVNGGLAYATNPCLSSEYAWAETSNSPTQQHVSFYLNTGNPGPTASTHWPPAGTTRPQACDGSWSQSCAYDYGWNAAQDSFNKAASASSLSAASTAPWWLDVETANSWSSTDLSTNRSDLQGAVAALRAVGVTSIGVYSNATMWGQITGAISPSSTLNDPFRSLPNWVPGARSLKEAPSYCSRTFTGGPVKFAQYPSNGFDADYVCP
jgi:hypothetical protein